MPAAIPTPSINITATPSTPSSSSAGTLASSPFAPGTLAAATALRRPSLVLSVGSFHSAQLRRPSFFAPFPYSQSPQQQPQTGSLADFGSSPRNLEANYCTDFSCCGLTLRDLHALLQHYEEAHVRFEEDDDHENAYPEEDGWSTSSESAPNSPQSSARQLNHHYHSLNGTHGTTLNPHAHPNANASTATTMAALVAGGQQKHTPLSLLNARKKSNGVSLSDIYSEETGFTPDDAVSAFPNSILRTAAQAKEASIACKKRDLAAYSTSFDAQSPLAKKTLVNQPNASASQTAASILGDLRSSHQAGNGTKTSLTSTSSTGSQEDLLSTVTGYLEHAIQQGMLPNCGKVGSPSYLLAAEDLIRKRDEIVSMMESIGKSGSSGADKPYRCSVSGCDKAYKNPNGLKYHNQHGHCSVPGVSEEDKFNSKPYRCTFLDCGKCYKNLNGLKYHIEHSHPNLAAALHAHIPGFATLDGSNISQAAIAAAAAIAAVQANPMMMAAANAIMASAATAAANNSAKSNGNINHSSQGSSHGGPSSRQSSSSPSDHTPDSSPNTSPSMGPIQTTTSKTMAYRGADPTFSADVTPMTSPILGHATLPAGLTPLSIQTSSSGRVSGLLTPSALSPTSAVSSPFTKSPNGGSQVSTLTAALAAVTVEQQRQQQQQQQQHQHQQSLGLMVSPRINSSAQQS